MSYPVGSNSHDLSLLEAAYQIGRFIQSFVTEDSKDKTGKLWSNYSDHFYSGPNPRFSQTKEGLVLKGCYGKPSIIHTPYGEWQILGTTRGDGDKIMEAIKEPLGLELIKEGEYSGLGTGYYGSYWAITKWEERKIDKPVYREESEYIPYDKVKEIWQEFSVGLKRSERNCSAEREESENRENEAFWQAAYNNFLEQATAALKEIDEEYDMPRDD